MPTGYTAGILDGKINTFKEFASTCVRAFGAAVHMRDEPGDKQYEPRIPSDYHKKAMAEAKEQLEKAKSLSDEEIIKFRRAELTKSINYHLDSLKKKKENRGKLDDFLAQALEWQEPTSDHKSFKTFMIDQLQTTIDHDCDTKYTDKELANLKVKMESIDPATVREQMIADATRDVGYHEEEYTKDVERCNDSNKWVTDLIDSIE